MSTEREAKCRRCLVRLEDQDQRLCDSCWQLSLFPVRFELTEKGKEEVAKRP